MDMAERPVVVAMHAKPVDVAGRVDLVPAIAGYGSMQHADVEQPRYRGWIVTRKVLRHRLVGKALPVDRYAEGFQCAGMRPFMVEDRHLRQAQRPGHFVGGVVVAANCEDRDVGDMQPPHLRGEEHPGAKIRPVAVVNISRDDDERHLFVQRQIHHPPQRPPGRAANDLHRRIGIGLQPAQRAIQMQVGGVQKFKIHVAV